MHAIITRWEQYADGVPLICLVCGNRAKHTDCCSTLDCIGPTGVV